MKRQYDKSKMLAGKSFFLTFALLLSFSFLMSEGETVELSGKVKVEGGRNLRNLVVYLAPMDTSSMPQSTKRLNVAQKGRKFQPNLITIVRGDTINFHNKVIVSHRRYKHKPVDISVGNKDTGGFVVNVIKKSFYPTTGITGAKQQAERY